MLGFRHALSTILDELEEKRDIDDASASSFDLSDSLNWRGKANCCKWIHVVVDKAPSNATHALFPRIITILSNLLSTSPHPQVQTSAREALFKIAASLKCPEFVNFSSLDHRILPAPNILLPCIGHVECHPDPHPSHTPLTPPPWHSSLTFLDGCISRKTWTPLPASVLFVRRHALSLGASPHFWSIQCCCRCSKVASNLSCFMYFQIPCWKPNWPQARPSPPSQRYWVSWTALEMHSTAMAWSNKIEDGVRLDSRQSQIGSGLAIAEILAVSGANQTAAYLRRHQKLDPVFVATLNSLPEAYETNSSDLQSLYSVCALDSYVPRLLAIISDSTSSSDFIVELAKKAIKKVLIRHHKVLGLGRVFEIIIDSFKDDVKSIIFLLQILTELISLIIPEQKMGYGAEYLLSHALLTRRTLHRLLSKILILKYAKSHSEDRESASEFNSIRSLSTALWKTLVSHPPKTVTDIIPIVCHDLTSSSGPVLEFGKECMLDLMERFGERFYIPFLTNLTQLDSTLPNVFRVISWASEFKHFKLAPQDGIQIPEQTACKVAAMFTTFIRTELSNPGLQYNDLGDILNNILPLISHLDSIHLLVDNLDAHSLSRLMDHESDTLADAILSRHTTPALIAKASTGCWLHAWTLVELQRCECAQGTFIKNMRGIGWPNSLFGLFQVSQEPREWSLLLHQSLLKRCLRGGSICTSIILGDHLEWIWKLDFWGLGCAFDIFQGSQEACLHKIPLGSHRIISTCCLSKARKLSWWCGLQHPFAIAWALWIWLIPQSVQNTRKLRFGSNSLIAISGQLIRAFTSTKSPILIESIILLLDNKENAPRLKAFYPQFLRVMQTGDGRWINVD